MLEKFRKAKQREMDMLERQAARGELPAPLDMARPSFVDALVRGRDRDGLAVIAEYKRASPSKGVINLKLTPEDVAEAYAAGGASALSVLTEEDYFQGSLDYLERMAGTGLPLLRKDFLLSPLQIVQTLATPASALLVIVRMFESDRDLAHMVQASLDAGLEPVVEIFSQDEVGRAQDAGARIIQVNNRDLDTLAVDLGISERLIAGKKDSELWISASGVSTNADLVHLQSMGFDAALVGTWLMSGDDPRAALSALMGKGS